MAIPRSRFRRVALAINVTLCVALLAAWVVSALVSVAYKHTNASGRLQLGFLGSGTLDFGWNLFRELGGPFNEGFSISRVDASESWRERFRFEEVHVWLALHWASGRVYSPVWLMLLVSSMPLAVLLRSSKPSRRDNSRTTLRTVLLALPPGVVALTWILSLKFGVIARGFGMLVMLGDGQLDIGWGEWLGDERHTIPPRILLTDVYGDPGLSGPEADLSFGGGNMQCPMWIVLIAATLPLVLMWRRRPICGEGHCTRCDYDLTLNRSGTCPECGLQLKSSPNATATTDRHDRS